MATANINGGDDSNHLEALPALDYADYIIDKDAIDVSDIENPKYNYHKIIDQEYIAKVHDSDREYVRLIRDLCKENGVDLYFVKCPVPDAVIGAISDYFVMMESVHKMFRDLGVKYIDTLNEEYFSHPTADTNFVDCPCHLTDTYSKVYTRAICKWIKDNSGQ